jgi:hypothetical protein
MANYQRKAIEDYPGYEIDTDGNVLSSFVFAPLGNGRAKRFIGDKKRILKPRQGKPGYLYVNIYKNNKRLTVKLHRLIAEAFIPNPNNNPCVCHKNDIKTDNRIENLYWGTLKDNTKDAMKNGTFKFTPQGEACSWSKMTQEGVLKMRKLYQQGKKITELAKLFNISDAQTHRIINKINWAHVT